jgi:GTPase
LIRSLEDVITNLQINSVPILLQTNDDIVQISRKIKEKNVMPVCMVSNVDWAGINLLKCFLSMLPVNEQVKGEENENVEVKLF